jgi:hypothetical protein
MADDQRFQQLAGTLGDLAVHMQAQTGSEPPCLRVAE